MCYSFKKKMYEMLRKERFSMEEKIVFCKGGG